LWIKKNISNKKEVKWKKLIKIAETSKFNYINELKFNKEINSFALVWVNENWHFLIKDFKNIYHIENSNDQILDLNYSKNWKVFVYKIRENYKDKIIINWKKWKIYNSISDIIVSDDWKNISYIAEKWNLKIITVIVKNWKEYKNITFDDKNIKIKDYRKSFIKKS
jgi:hypothetical protein